MQRKWLVLSSVACGTFMATLDSSIVNVALPSITASFHTGLAQSRWVVISYLFSITGLLLFFGKLADVVGRKSIFSLGFVTFTIGSALCGFAGSVEQLIIFRGVQGFGAAMLMANGPALITSTFPANELGKALGTLAMVVSAGLAIGPTAGGLLVRLFAWPAVFFVNIPFGILGAYLVHRNIPAELGMHVDGDLHRRDPAAKAAEGQLTDQQILEREKRLPLRARVQIYVNRLRYFDWLGAILWMFIQLGYGLAIDQQNVLGLAGPLQRFVSFAAAGLFVLFLIWEWSIQDPVLDLSLFKTRNFLTSNVSGLLNVVAISSVTLLMPFYFQNVRNLAPHQVGLLMTAIPLTIFVVAPVSGRLSDKYGSRTLATIGMGLLCLAMLLLSLPFQGLLVENPKHTVFYLCLVGAGVGLFQSPNNNSIMGAVNKKHLGVASALLATVRNLGLVTGVALSTTLLMYFYNQQTQRELAQQVMYGSIPASPAENFVWALRITFMALAGLCSLGIITSLMHESKDRHRRR
jgi:MFS family permease